VPWLPAQWRRTPRPAASGPGLREPGLDLEEFQQHVEAPPRGLGRSPLVDQLTKKRPSSCLGRFRPSVRWYRAARESARNAGCSRYDTTTPSYAARSPARSTPKQRIGSDLPRCPCSPRNTAGPASSRLRQRHRWPDTTAQGDYTARRRATARPSTPTAIKKPIPQPLACRGHGGSAHPRPRRVDQMTTATSPDLQQRLTGRRRTRAMVRRTASETVGFGYPAA
jgi:hypothetical protein